MNCPIKCLIFLNVFRTKFVLGLDHGLVVVAILAVLFLVDDCCWAVKEVQLNWLPGQLLFLAAVLVCFQSLEKLPG